MIDQSVASRIELRAIVQNILLSLAYVGHWFQVVSAHLRVLVRQLFDELLVLSLHVPAFLVITPSIARIKLLTVLGKTVFVVSNCPDRVAHQQIL